jgi:hypothetical protein
MILKIFSPKKLRKNWRFLTPNKAKLCQIFIITLVFEKNANFFAENWQKSQKIVIITSTPGRPTKFASGDANWRVSIFVGQHQIWPGDTKFVFRVNRPLSISEILLQCPDVGRNSGKPVDAVHHAVLLDTTGADADNCRN